jgi:cytochrome c553
MSALTPVLAASTVQVAGTLIALVAVVGFVVYSLFNIRAGREEVGSELELAANLKPYYDDDELETKKLDRTLTMGLATLAVVGIGLPAYWLAEPGRQEGAIDQFESVFASRGERLYTEGAQCNACHGPEGVGGVASFTILDADSEFVAQVEWLAPALNNVLLRYDREEVTYILDYGRPFSPMPAWGAPGGGPLTEQQVENLVDYLQAIQIPSVESKEAVEAALRGELGVDGDAPIDYTSLETGEALFNLGRETGFAGGAYACGRCHTRGWSIRPESARPETADLAPYIAYPDGAGGYGPRLRGELIPRQFADVEELAEFLHNGAVRGQPYGQQGMSGDGMMPGFGDNPNTEEPDDGMLTDEMILSIARYVASLEADVNDIDNEAIQPADRGIDEDADARSATDLDDPGREDIEGDLQDTEEERNAIEEDE